jgi:hypothetical protein
MQGRGRGNVAAERLCGALFVGLTTLKGYFYTNLGGTLVLPKRRGFQNQGGGDTGAGGRFLPGRALKPGVDLLRPVQGVFSGT